MDSFKSIEFDPDRFPDAYWAFYPTLAALRQAGELSSVEIQFEPWKLYQAEIRGCSWLIHLEGYASARDGTAGDWNLCLAFVAGEFVVIWSMTEGPMASDGTWADSVEHKSVHRIPLDDPRSLDKLPELLRP